MAWPAQSTASVLRREEGLLGSKQPLKEAATVLLNRGDLGWELAGGRVPECVASTQQEQQQRLSLARRPPPWRASVVLTTLVLPSCPLRSDIGCQIDGYITQAAHSLVVQADAAAPVTGRAADVIACAQTCFDAAARLIRPGKKISEVPPVLAKIAEAYGCK